MESLVFKTQSERNIGKQRRSRSCGNYLNFGCTDFTCRYIQISAHKSGRDDFREDYLFHLPEQCWKVPLYRM